MQSKYSQNNIVIICFGLSSDHIKLFNYGNKLSLIWCLIFFVIVYKLDIIHENTVYSCLSISNVGDPGIKKELYPVLLM